VISFATPGLTAPTLLVSVLALVCFRELCARPLSARLGQFGVASIFAVRFASRLPCCAWDGTEPATRSGEETCDMAKNSEVREKQEQTAIPTEKKLDQLYELIDGIEMAMMTTRRADGSLVSRPMATQARAEGTDLWFMTDAQTAKVDELVADQHVNLGYYNSETREYVSVSGLAHVTQDPVRIHELYKPDWKAWLGDLGDDRDGSANDPRIALIEVQAQSATYLKADRPRAVALFEVVKGMITGEPAKVGVEGRLDSKELKRGAAR
jgi:general stress protein 26